MAATASSLPAELPALVLQHLVAEYAPFAELASSLADQSFRRGHRMIRISVLGPCSLVCVLWANICRQCLFYDGVLLYSRHDFEMLAFFVKYGSRRLVPLPVLTHRWRLHQDWAARSWCHRWYKAFPRREQFQRNTRPSEAIVLRGPVPSGLPLAALHSPHWSLPKSMPACFFAFRDVTLSDVCFPSARSFGKLARHFKGIEYLTMKDVVMENLVAAVVPSIRSNTVRRLLIEASRTAGSSAAVAPAFVQAIAVLRPGPSFSQLPQGEWELVPALLLSGISDLDAHDRLSVLVKAILLETSTRVQFGPSDTKPDGEYRVVLATARDLDVDVTARRVVGIYVAGAYFEPSNDSARQFAEIMANFLATLKACLGSLPALRVVVLEFQERALVDAALEIDPGIFEPISSEREITYRLCYPAPTMPDMPGEFFFGVESVDIVDPATLERTGENCEQDRALAYLLGRHHPELVMH